IPFHHGKCRSCYRKDGVMCNGGAACNWGFVLTETSSFDGFWAGPCQRTGLGKEEAEISLQPHSLTALAQKKKVPPPLR
ncbi:uncharacterized protein CEXT_32501, partial [Caerostris extrusa]